MTRRGAAIVQLGNLVIGNTLMSDPRSASCPNRRIALLPNRPVAELPNRLIA